jgi:hypothetical protein
MYMATQQQLDAGQYAFVEHDFERMECSEHEGFCCPADDAHDMNHDQAIRHQVSVIINTVAPQIVAEERRIAVGARGSSSHEWVAESNSIEGYLTHEDASWAVTADNRVALVHAVTGDGIALASVALPTKTIPRPGGVSITVPALSPPVWLRITAMYESRTDAEEVVRVVRAARRDGGLWEVDAK